MKKRHLFSLFLCFAIGLGSLLSLSSCALFEALNSAANDKPKYNYLGELYQAEQVTGAFYLPIKTGYYYDVNSEKIGKYEYAYSETVTMGGVEFESDFSLNSAGYSYGVDTFIHYKIPSGKWKSLCFAIGSRDNDNLKDKLALEVRLNDSLVYEEMIYSCQDVKYVSLDVSNVTDIKFFVNKSWEPDGTFHLGAVSLFEEAKATIDPGYAKAAIPEDFLSNSKTILCKESDCAMITGEEEKPYLVDNRRLTKGLAFIPDPPLTGSDPTTMWSGDEAIFNCYGRYKYLHFRVGHVDNYRYNGSVIFFLNVDGRRIKEIHVRDIELAQEIVVDINYGHYVAFEAYPDGTIEENQIDFTRVACFAIFDLMGSPSEASPYRKEAKTYQGSYKLLSEFKTPYFFANAIDRNDSIIVNKGSYLGTPLCGVLYTEGLVLESVFNMMTSTWNQVPAQAYFNLEKAFRYFSFVVGRRDRSAMCSDTLNIYGDGELLQSIALNSTCEAREYIVDVKSCQVLKIELVGRGNVYRGVYNIVDMAVHTDQYRKLDFTHRPKEGQIPDGGYPAGTSKRLMEDIYAYDSFSGANEQDVLTSDRKNTGEYKPLDGRSFVAGGGSHDAGFVLKTGDYVGLQDGPAIGALFFCNAFFFLDTVHCASFIGFNLMGEFTTLEFDVATVNGVGAGDTKILRMFGDSEEIQSMTVVGGEQSQHFVVNVRGVYSLIFFLEYGEAGITDSTAPFGFYNLVVSK